jgi:hypothetical protein
MNIDELLELLEIESPDEFEYFEHLAELIECMDDIPYDVFFSVLNVAEPLVLTELLDSYFEDSLQGIPDEAADFYTLFLTIRQSLIGLAGECTSLEQRRLFVDELYRFRTWYTFESIVHCINRADNTVFDVPVVEALSLFRLEKLGETIYQFDFTESLNYPVEEYTVSFTYSLKEEDNEEDEEIIDEFSNQFIDKDFPVIDGENSDEELDENRDEN